MEQTKPTRTLTGGNVIVEDIKIGDIHYECEYGCCFTSEVISLPAFDGKGYSWKSKSVKNPEKVQEYYVTVGMSHYAPKLYDYLPYKGLTEV